jgi:hypothetical protein
MKGWPERTKDNRIDYLRTTSPFRNLPVASNWTMWQKIEIGGAAADFLFVCLSPSPISPSSIRASIAFSGIQNAYKYPA